MQRPGVGVGARVRLLSFSTAPAGAVFTAEATRVYKGLRKPIGRGGRASSDTGVQQMRTHGETQEVWSKPAGKVAAHCVETWGHTAKALD